jgi:hypothetical protein
VPGLSYHEFMGDPTPRPMYRLDRSAFSVTSLTEQDDEGAYWKSRTPQERMAALEFLRRIAYGNAATGRLQRVLTVAELGED